MSLRGLRVLVTGGAGFLGRHVCQDLRSYQPHSIIVPRSRDWDLRSRIETQSLFKDEKPNVVIHLAAVCGGIGANQAEPGRFFYENAAMGLNVLEACRLHGCRKLVLVGTVCAYPEHCLVPFREDDLWSGYPEPTNAPYGLAKKMILAAGQAYRAQYCMDVISVLPANLYGPGDELSPARSHVIPALICKALKARDSGAESIELWGTGNATRDFLYVEDAADGICRATASYSRGEPVNLGSGQEVRIYDLAQEICHQVGFEGFVRFNSDRPDGQPRRCLDSSRARVAFGWDARTGLSEGLRRTIAWVEAERKKSSAGVDDRPPFMSR